MNELQKALARVLLVDDEPLVLKYTTSVITGLGYANVRKARTAQEARTAIAEERVDLVVCDVSLPDGDGRQVIREILEQNPEATAVLITGFLAAELALPDDLRGRVKLLEKPFTADDIGQLLAETCERSTAVQAVSGGEV